jgi:hypothetical protein
VFSIIKTLNGRLKVDGGISEIGLAELSASRDAAAPVSTLPGKAPK